MRRCLPATVLVLALVAGACGGGGGGSSSAYCKALRDTAKESAEESKKAPSTSIDYKAAKDRLNKAITKLSASAPSELKGDYKTVSDYYQLYLDNLSNPSTADRSKLSSLTSQAQAAGKRIADYNKKECNYQTTTVPRQTVTVATPPTTAKK